jgi:hypothetical protein
MNPTIVKSIRSVAPASETRDTRWLVYCSKITAFVNALPDEAHVVDFMVLRLTSNWQTKLYAYKRQCMREYLGGKKLRSYTQPPKILTPAWLETTKAANFANRLKREPYFVKIADLYKQIAELESD